MDSSPIVTPPITFRQKVASFVSKNKNLILIALILAISVLDLGMFLSKQGIVLGPIASKTAPSKITEKNMLATTQDCAGTPYSDEYGVDVIYCYDGSLQDKANPDNSTYKEPVIGNQEEVIKEAVKNTSNLCAQQDNSCTLQGCAPTSSGSSCGGCDCSIRITPQDLRPLLSPTAVPPTPVPPTDTPKTVAKTPVAANPTPTPEQCSWGGTNPNLPPCQPPTSTPYPSGFDSQPVPKTSFPSCADYTGDTYQLCIDLWEKNRAQQGTAPEIDKAGNLLDGLGNIISKIPAQDIVTSPLNPITSPIVTPIKLISGVFSEPEPNETRAELLVYTPGLGTNTTLGQNPTPIRTQDLRIQILDSNDQVIKDGVLSLAAEQIPGKTPTNTGFGGLFSFGKNLPVGNYKTRVKLDNTLWKTINTNLTPGSQTNLPPLELILGDIDQDNQISLVDYNMLISCFGQNICTQKVQADLNLDGKIDETDLNLLYNSFKTRLGQ